MVIVLVFGLATVSKLKDLWREPAGVTATFQGLPLFIGGDFNVTLKSKGCPNDMD